MLRIISGSIRTLKWWGMIIVTSTSLYVTYEHVGRLEKLRHFENAQWWQCLIFKCAVDALLGHFTMQWTKEMEELLTAERNWDKLLAIERQVQDYAKNEENDSQTLHLNILCSLHKVYGLLWQFDWRRHISCTCPAVARHQYKQCGLAGSPCCFAAVACQCVFTSYQPLHILPVLLFSSYLLPVFLIFTTIGLLPLILHLCKKDFLYSCQWGRSHITLGYV